MFVKKVSEHIEHGDAYVACLGLMEEYAHPGIGPIRFNQAFGFMSLGTVATWFFTSGHISSFFGYLLIPVAILSFYPTYIKIYKVLNLFFKDLVMTEYRSNKQKKNNLRNFYE